MFCKMHVYLTEPGEVGIFANILHDELRYDLKVKIDISLVDVFVSRSGEKWKAEEA